MNYSDKSILPMNEHCTRGSSHSAHSTECYDSILDTKVQLTESQSYPSLEPTSNADQLLHHLNIIKSEINSRRQSHETNATETSKVGRQCKHHKRRRRSYDFGANEDCSLQWSNGRRSRNATMVGTSSPPKHVHCSDWREMLELVEAANSCADAQNTKNAGSPDALQMSNNALTVDSSCLPSISGTIHMRARAPSSLSLRQSYWISQVFKKRECAKFISSSKYPNKCGCGRSKAAHSSDALLSSNFITPDKLLNVSSFAGDLSPVRKDELVERLVMASGSDTGLSSRRITKMLSERWTIRKHTVVRPTDAFGTIEFQGGPHPYKAQYLRLNVETDPAEIMNLFDNVWQMPPPKLIITVHGGLTNFDLQPKLARVFRKGLMKAARTTGAWIITSGVNAGVVRHVAAALEASNNTRARSKVVSIGIAAWGMLKEQADLIGQDIVVPYHSHSYSTRGRLSLNNRHSHFLLVDNGTVGRDGADIILRKRLETYIAEKQKIGGGTRSVPVVCVVLEGGTCTIKSVVDYVTSTPLVPVVICDGSGRAADLLAFAHQCVQEDGKLPDNVRPQLLSLVESVFGYNKQNAESLLADLTKCAQQKNLMTIFRLGEGQKQDLDHSILTALLKGQNLSAPDQLSLALAWNRVDIARSDIFILGQDWPKSALNNAMMEALMNDRVDFVRLLLENGVSMKKFLTISRLEELYNTDKGPPNTLYYIVRDVVKIRPGYRYRMPHIGLAIEKLMGNAYKSTYTTEAFRAKWAASRSRSKMNQKAGGDLLKKPSVAENVLGLPHSVAKEVSGNVFSAASGSRALSTHLLWRSALRRDNPMNTLNSMLPPNLNESKEIAIDIEDDSNASSFEDREDDFKYPFSELLLWAVLTKRQEMALCMWQHGEEAMAKALVACRLYKSLAKEAAEDYLEVEICDELRNYAEEFRKLALELLEHCYHQDDAQTLQLLTYELASWGNETCLSLAVMVNHKEFLAHPCCQILLADLWHGGLRIRSHSNLRVVLGLLFPPSIFLLEFKSREELMLQPQTAAEHEDDIKDSSSSSSSSSESESSSSDSDYSSDDDSLKNEQDEDRRKNSSNSLQSLNLTGLFQSRRKKARSQKDKDCSIGPAGTNNGSVAPQVLGDLVNAAAVTLANSAVPPVPFSPVVPSTRSRAPSIQSQQSFQFGYLQGSKKSPSRQSSMKGYKHDAVFRSESGGGSKAGCILPQKISAHHGHRKSLDPEMEKINLNRSTNVTHIAGITIARARPIKSRRKLYEFYVAPITTFWAWTLSFCLFVCCYTYTLLVRTPVRITELEWFTFAYVFGFGMEHWRKYLFSEPKSFTQKARHFFWNIWNALTALAVVTYFIGFALRANPSTRDSYGRIILACNSVLWTIRLLDFMSVHPRLGPYITMAGKMVQNMLYIIVLLCVALLGFGLARQSITYPNEDWHPILLRNIFYKPYFMLYGEVYADEIDPCGDEAWDRHMENGTPIEDVYNDPTGKMCVPGHWVPPLLMTFFLLVANILLMSMLLAIFNNIFDQTDKISKEIWLFQRYRQVMEYESTPFIPPPFTPVYHLWMVFKYIRVKRGYCLRAKDAVNPKKKLFDFTLKLFLDEDQVEKVQDFEEDCMEDLAREKEYKKNTSNEERIHRTAERSDLILSRLNDLTAKESVLKGSLRDFDERLANLEKQQSQVLDCMRQIVSTLPFLMSNVTQRSISSPSSGPQSFHFRQEEDDFLEETFEPDDFSPRTPDETVALKETARASQSFPQKKNTPQVVTKRMRTTTVTGCDERSRKNSISQTKSGRYGSLFSLNPQVLKQIVGSSSQRKSPRGSIRHRRRHHEYTSITDAINIDDILPKLQVLADDEQRFEDNLDTCLHTTDNEDEVEEDEEGGEVDYSGGTDTPSTTLRRAKPSFLMRQNTVLKEYEEGITERMMAAQRKEGDASPTHSSRGMTEDEFGSAELRGNKTHFGHERMSSTFEDDEQNSSREYIEFTVRSRCGSQSKNSAVSGTSRHSLSITCSTPRSLPKVSVRDHDCKTISLLAAPKDDTLSICSAPPVFENEDRKSCDESAINM